MITNEARERSAARCAIVFSLALVLGAALLPGPAAARAQDEPADAPEQCAARLCAGAARADITPPIGTPMWGYSARAFYSQFERWAEQRARAIDTDLYAKVLFLRSEGVHTRLYARAIVLRKAAGTKMALVQTDLGAITGELHRAVANEIEHLGIAREFLLLSATHTHGGPGASQQPLAHGLLVGDTYDPRVFARIVDGVVTAITEADDRLAPARVGLGQGLITDASINRSHVPHLGNPCPDPDAVADHACDHDHEDAQSLHSIDPVVTVLRVDRVDGVPLGAWTSFAAHGTMFWSDDIRFSADNQGYAERMVEAGIADRARAKGVTLPPDHEIVAAYANGTEGDIAPVGSGRNRFIRAEDSGRRQAAGVLAVYDALGSQMTDDLALDARWDWVYMTGDGGTSPLAILGAGPDCPFGRNGIPELIPGHGSKCPFLVLSGTGPNWFSLQTLRIGDVGIAAFPGEMTVQMGRRVRKRILDSSFNDGEIDKAIVVGLANDYMAYTTTPEEYDFQWYEGTFTLWGRRQGPFIADRLGALADAMLGGPEVTYLEPPDTSGLQSDNRSASEPLSHVTDGGGPTPGTKLTEVPNGVERGTVVGFAWVGGEPSVELQPDVAFVTTERQVVTEAPESAPGPPDGKGLGRCKPGKKPKPGCEPEPPAAVRWEPVFTDEGYEDLLDYWREGVVDRWGTQWDVTLDQPAGLYRFVVRGFAWEGGRAVEYRVVSDPFEVVRSDDISIASIEPASDGILVKATYPHPSGTDHPAFGDPPPYMHECSAAKPGATLCGNFRWRPALPTTGTVTVEITGTDGIVRTASGTYDAAAGGYVVNATIAEGETVSVAVGGLVDTWGNFNGASFTR